MGSSNVFSLNNLSLAAFKLSRKISSGDAFNPFTPRVSYGDIKVILTSESVDEIL